MAKKRVISTPLLRIRRERDLSQAQLAERVHSSQPQIDRLEKSQRKMTKEWAMRLATALDCHWLELMDELPLNKRELDLVERLRGLGEEEQAAVYRIIDSMGPKPTR